MNENLLTFRLVQEFHRAGVAVGRCLAQANRCLAQFLILFWRKCRRGRFFENLLVAALNRAVAHAGGPGSSVVVGDDLDFDVARSLHELLQENRRVAKGFEGLGARALKSLWKLAGRANTANAVTAAARRGLNKERVAQPLSVAFGIGERFHRAVAPGRNRNLRLLG